MASSSMDGHRSPRTLASPTDATGGTTPSAASSPSSASAFPSRLAGGGGSPAATIDANEAPIGITSFNAINTSYYENIYMY